MKVVYEIWFENKSGRVFGERLYWLLRGVRKTGSLRKAAAAMPAAYSYARRLIVGCERSLGLALTNRRIGGASGGGSEVTREAAWLMRQHEALCAEAEDAIGKAYKRHFGQPAQVQLRAGAAETT